MSGRIDELVLDGCAFVACPRPQDCDTCPLIQLATIARENAAEADRERMRLAACGVAAIGYFDGCADEYKSASLDDVLRCRVEADKWRKVAEYLSHRLGVKSWMSLTGITRRALGGDDEDTRDVFVQAEAASQLEAALAAVEQEEAE
jgi:hypothetical protein